MGDITYQQVFEIVVKAVGVQEITVACVGKRCAQVYFCFLVLASEVEYQCIVRFGAFIPGRIGKIASVFVLQGHPSYFESESLAYVHMEIGLGNPEPLAVAPVGLAPDSSVFNLHEKA